MKTKPQTSSNSSERLSWIGLAIVFVTVLITAAVTWFLYTHTVNLLTDNLRQRLLAIVTTEVSHISAEDVNALQEEEDWQKPEWRRIVTQLKKAKDNNSDIVFVYIFRKTAEDPTQMEFVADAESINPYANHDDDPTNDVDANNDGVIEPDGPDYLQWPGQEYPEPPEETFEAYDGPLTNRELYEDAWGPVLTGYAPIRDDNGNTVAVLAVDIKANDFLTITRQTLYPFLLFIIFLVITILVLAGVLIKLWNKRVELFAELDRQKDELLSMVSHQLHSPITAVRWYVELLLGEDKDKLSEEQKNTLGEVQDLTLNLVDLVNMILDISRIQLGRVNIERQELKLNILFDEVWKTIEPKVQEKNIQFEKQISADLPLACLDKRYTRMAIENLLTNAVKYTPSGGAVTWKVQVENEQLVCTVSDTGCGIPAEDQDKIFGKLYRASNVRNEVDGNGFGLYISKGAIEAQNGSISFVSREGKGTTFTVRLPLEPPEGCPEA